jgi:hypothetical protein
MTISKQHGRNLYADYLQSHANLRYHSASRLLEIQQHPRQVPHPHCLRPLLYTPQSQPAALV